MAQALHLSAGGAGVAPDVDDVDVEAPISNDPIISSDLATFQPSLSRARGEPSMLTLHNETGPLDANENEPLLGTVGGKRVKKPFYRARPLWIVPFVIIASLVRGMTIAPRVEVFTQLSCTAIHGRPIDYNHTQTSVLLTAAVGSPYRSNGYVRDVTVENSSGFSEFDSDDDGGDDPMRVPSTRCLTDPKVQAGAARIQTIMTTTMGTLSALTTGWWGHFGERHGRIRVLIFATIGLFLTDLIFVLVSMPHSPLSSHGHKLLIIAPIIEGLLGGWSTLQGATTAYVSDCTSEGSRAHVFSRFTGVFYVGFALGPMIGAFIITHPPKIPLVPATMPSVGKTVTPVFWIAMLCSLVNLLLIFFVIPESLGKERRRARREAEAAAKVSALVEREVQGFKAGGGIPSAIKSLFMPLSVFLPKKRASHMDWNMTFLALALFGYLLSSGIFQLKYLYAEHAFGWSTEQLSYYITFAGGMRAIHLLFFMPLMISVFKSKAKTPAIKGPNGKKLKPTKAQLAVEMKFDLLISRLSYAIDILSHVLVSVSSTTPTVGAQAAFVCFSVLSSFGSSVVPSVQSLALCMTQADAAEEEEALAIQFSNRETPRPTTHSSGVGGLFGALAVLQATGQMILGPMLFGLVYSSTVATFPKSIFMLAASILIISISLLTLVHPSFVAAAEKKRLPKQKDPHRRRQMPEIERGRSRVSKDLSSGHSWPSSYNSIAGVSGVSEVQNNHE